MAFVKYFVIIFRLLIAYFAFRGTYAGWSGTVPHDMIYFTTQSNLLVGFICVWSAFSLLFDTKQPPAWLKCADVLYILITGLVANFVLDLSEIHCPKVLLGMTTLDMVHIVTPILFFIDFILFNTHKTLKIKYSAFWLVYPVAYFTFILIINAANPKIGYPYPFIDLNILAINQLIVNIIVFSISFYLLGLIIVGIDRILPNKILI
ncbi:MAG: Pr6Pr family membrane protein [Prevotellaceae bacterium]|jgi:hypothetical protein|nr:Pr6Pr family membrane protein [Prevotellaceae bacterium]